MIDVKRYSLLMVDRYAGDGSGERETHAYMKACERGEYVRADDYDALLARLEAAEQREQALAAHVYDFMDRLGPIAERLYNHDPKQGPLVAGDVRAAGAEIIDIVRPLVELRRQAEESP